MTSDMEKTEVLHFFFPSAIVLPHSPEFLNLKIWNGESPSLSCLSHFIGMNGLSGLQAHIAGSCPILYSPVLPVFLQRPSINAYITQTVFILWTVPIKVQDLTYGLVEVQVDPLLKPATASLDATPSLKLVNCTTQLGVT